MSKIIKGVHTSILHFLWVRKCKKVENHYLTEYWKANMEVGALKGITVKKYIIVVTFMSIKRMLRALL